MPGQPENADQIDAGESSEGFGDAVVGVVTPDQGAEVFDAAPRDGAAGVNGVLAEGLAEVTLAGPARPADPQVFVPLDPF